MSRLFYPATKNNPAPDVISDESQNPMLEKALWRQRGNGKSIGRMGAYCSKDGGGECRYAFKLSDAVTIFE